ncbi:type VI secretion system tip protein TssI/VgrG [Phytobacter diazotrophicus]|uniref:type VI secretion system Vgr family protein n=1 Tax=Phytobacter diazotrophicus TaxID=395631 RepID=UPI00232EEF65|nr:type VI secretion system tip protein TssI/VgrG [Phytobacter diazotrophicus]MDC0727984.1 type VI secretion system tip protein TssI/VgrG [Phytobacter diazotrophicus]MDC0735258.1 type VI secretion system tip protein TssI/VgrG [Phytobacter diazotrophicus]
MLNRITVQLPVDGLLFWKLSGREALSEPYALGLTLLGTDARIDRSQLLGKSVTVTVPTQDMTSPRYFNGKVTRVAVSAVELSGTRYAVYQLSVESDLWPMQRDRNLRIFQGQTVPQIVKTLLSESKVNVEDKLSESYRVWDYCVQYQESSFDFISRLMELEGISYFFRHESGRHVMVLTDAASQHQPFAGYETIPYHVTPSGGSTDEEGISQWALTDSVTPGIYSLDDYDFRKPNAWLFQARQNPNSPEPGSINVYDWPGRFVDHGHGEFYARIHQERWQVEHQQIQGSATALGITPGHTFTLYNAPFFSDNAEYLTTEANYWLEENAYASGGSSQTMHRIDFTVIPSSVTYRPAQKTAWPRTYGPQTAKVVGPQGESIWTDRYGRVKVKFHWDRQAKGDDTSSCWVRVSSAWAGQGFGGVQIPRVGDEVVVDFINGDPDRPIITGRVYNEASMPPWDLPGDATRMGFMTRSKDGSVDNASFLFFEDSPGNESVQMHSEKDMMVSVENDQTVNIDGNRTTTIKKTQTDEVRQDATFYYKAKRTTTVDDVEAKSFNNSEITSIKNGRKLTIENDGDESSITGDRKLILNGNNSREISGNDTTHIKGMHDKTIDSGERITITSGGQNQTISDNVKVDINGEWSQTVTGQIVIKSPQQITIKSDTKVFIDSPVFERNDVQKTSFAQDAMDYLVKQFTISLGTVALKAGSYAFTGVDVSHKGFTFGRTIVNAQRVEAARVDSGSLKTALFALYMVM